MSARDEILHLINRYGFTIDTGDFEGLASLFEHGEWGMEGAEMFAGKEQVRAITENVRVYEDGTPRTKHVTTNVDLEIDEETGTAKSQCYVTVFQQTEEFPLQAIFSGHYFDDFERREGVWRFKKRLLRHILVGDMSAHLKEPAFILPKESSV